MAAVVAHVALLAGDGLCISKSGLAQCRVEGPPHRPRQEQQRAWSAAARPLHVRAKSGRRLTASSPSPSERRPCAATLSEEHADASTSESGVRHQVVVIDNYDSFTYNICQYLGDLGCNYEVYRNDQITVEEIRRMNPGGILISPGPGRPEDSGIALEAVEKLGPEFPLFGVCMGHQCIGQVFGGQIVRAPTGLMHGKTSPVFHNNVGILEGMPSPFTAARYHSLVIENETFPHDQLEITAWTEDGTVMGVRHKTYPHVQGVQFHPESIITQDGKTLLKNFMLSLKTKQRVPS
eukprot:jgi/Chlat1/5075/Chrsp33S05066